ncbi:sugar ABC transporter permease [Mesorhizobium sp. CO1-1-7]|uniref:sn-glycerol-3-phosphate transport system permease protein UgpA n=1 Tax=Mesorhizobium australicum (strain HAMBI 3006 / LMG 24608 / WSM2073) TaxID=754035 RepID=L0KI63_MESAW|nr:MULTISPECIES: sugar ABC transporter permease [Mesorhizobium]AGB44089.1 permease component of ABC-type sugar transporter [Mesorhizobium australicum WSM2073]MBZ9680166.1 sugar ABC transporter permease [Mesorhizobium sp. CO1-1-2]MBZ9695432.1 sugar ABC transporter permease [Mesorhizobium sp. CO1-1-9]MBZ9726593.1 sugar ABC transporter permease [Mesorhizobium sp. CO1-1-11]MBZ9747267.1 sugar ABC transporter permease [Mesorhizobium sp. CO1-1-7]
MEKRVTFGSWTIGILFAVPQLLLIFTFFYWPAGQAVYWSLTLQQPWGGGNIWVGLDNFRSILANADYWNSITASLVFAGISTGLAMFVALVLAALTDRQLAGSWLYRVVLIWPYGIAAPALALAFRFILAPEAGFMAVVNQVWPGFWDPGLDGADAMASIIIAFSWKYVGYNFIFFLAAFQAIPRSLIEAAAMDGSGVMRRFWDIQFPLITPTIFFLLVINITESFQDSFGIVDIMTSGGPANATNLMVYKIYSDGFKGLDYSGAAAQSIILMLLIIVLTIFQFRFIERRVHYR